MVALFLQSRLAPPHGPRQPPSCHTPTPGLTHPRAALPGTALCPEETPSSPPSPQPSGAPLARGAQTPGQPAADHGLALSGTPAAPPDTAPPSAGSPAHGEHETEALLFFHQGWATISDAWAPHAPLRPWPWPLDGPALLVPLEPTWPVTALPKPLTFQGQRELLQPALPHPTNPPLGCSFPSSSQPCDVWSPFVSLLAAKLRNPPVQWLALAAHWSCPGYHSPARGALTDPRGPSGTQPPRWPAASCTGPAPHGLQRHGTRL